MLPKVCAWITVITFTKIYWILPMHSNVTIKNVSWPYFSWPTLYTTNVQHSSSSCNGASGVLQITGSNTLIFAVLDAWITHTLCFKLKSFFASILRIGNGQFDLPWDASWSWESSLRVCRQDSGRREGWSNSRHGWWTSPCKWGSIRRPWQVVLSRQPYTAADRSGCARCVVPTNKEPVHAWSQLHSKTFR